MAPGKLMENQYMRRSHHGRRTGPGSGSRCPCRSQGLPGSRGSEWPWADGGVGERKLRVDRARTHNAGGTLPPGKKSLPPIEMISPPPLTIRELPPPQSIPHLSKPEIEL